MPFSNQVLQEEVLFALGNRGDFTVAVGSRLERWINIAQIKIAREKAWEELEQANTELTLPASAITLAYPVATNFRYQLSIIVKDKDSSKKLEWLHPAEFDKRFAKLYDSTATFVKDTPSFFTNWARGWAFWPVPNKEYKLNAKIGVWPADLTTLAQVTSLRDKDDLIILLATADIFDSLGSVEKARGKFAIYSANLERAKNDGPVSSGRELKPVFEISPAITDYWVDPFIKGIN